MCFFKSEKPENKNVKIAANDIECYKILERNNSYKYVSPYRDVVYFKNRLADYVIKKSRFQIEHKHYAELTKGLHSYSTLAKAKDQTIGMCSWMVYKAVIPAGTKYYYNPEWHEYISEKLIVYNEILN